jgi:integrase
VCNRNTAVGKLNRARQDPVFGPPAPNVSPWHPNQLRHLRATEARRAFGLEAAQVLLGHSRADVTQIYAEKNEALAAMVAAKIG